MLDRWPLAQPYRPIESRLEKKNILGLSVERTAEGLLPTRTGLWQIVSYRENSTCEEHIALYKGGISASQPLLTRLHSSCVTAETFHATNCDCHEQLEETMGMIEKEKRGLIVWFGSSRKGEEMG